MMDQDNSRSDVTSEDKFYDFIEAAAHDLQAPLRKLSVLVERVFAKNEAKFDQNTKEYIDRIESCVDQMKTLIDGLLDLARANGQPRRYEACDLNRIARESLTNTNENGNAMPVIIDADTLPTVQGNLVQYQQLFTNIFDNAFKFSRRDASTRIEIRTSIATEEEKEKFHLDDKKYYRIEISDNGIGFNPANEQKIFDPFVRLHPKSEYAGNGLGLSVCKKIAANHNGIIYAEGNEEQGARFILILPETP